MPSGWVWTSGRPANAELGAVSSTCGWGRTPSGSVTRCSGVTCARISAATDCGSARISSRTRTTWTAASQSWPSSSDRGRSRPWANRHRDALDRVVLQPVVVPGLLERLHVPRGIRGTHDQLVLPRFGLPVDTPRNPFGGGRLLPERGILPAHAAVGAHLHPDDPAPSRPRATAELDRTGSDHPGPGEEVREPRWDHQRAREDPGHVDALIVRVITSSIREHLEPLEPVRNGFDPGQPLHARHAVPAGDEEPQRRAVLREQGLAVHPPCE